MHITYYDIMLHCINKGGAGIRHNLERFAYKLFNVKSISASPHWGGQSMTRATLFFENSLNSTITKLIPSDSTLTSHLIQAVQ